MLKEFSSFLSLITPTHLGIVFGIVIIYTATMSWILLYHWQEYGTGGKAIIWAEITYLAVTGILLTLMVIFFYLSYVSL